MRAPSNTFRSPRQLLRGRSLVAPAGIEPAFRPPGGSGGDGPPASGGQPCPDTPKEQLLRGRSLVAPAGIEPALRPLGVSGGRKAPCSKSASRLRPAQRAVS